MYRVFILGLVLIIVSGSELYPQAQPAKPAEAPPEPPPVLSVPRDYKYDRRGRRDPFVNPLPEEKPATSTSGPPPPPPAARRPPGLPGVLIAEAGISAVVVSKEPSMNVVAISAPGGKTYFARVGDRLYDAVVKEITMNTVKFTLSSPGADQKAPREITRTIGTPSGENK